MQNNKQIDISVTLPGYYIVENNVARKVTFEEFNEYMASQKVVCLVIGD